MNFKDESFKEFTINTNLYQPTSSNLIKIGSNSKYNDIILPHDKKMNNSSLGL